MQSEGTVLNCICKHGHGLTWTSDPDCPIHGKSSVQVVIQQPMWRTEITTHEWFDDNYFGSFGQECKKRNGWELVAVFRERKYDGSETEYYCYRAVWKRFQ